MSPYYHREICNQFLTNVNKLLESSTISTDKIQLTELPKESVLPTGSILPKGINITRRIQIY